MKIHRPPSNQPLPPQAQRVFTGKIFEVWQWQQKLFDGRMATFEKLRRPDSVNILPVTRAGKIILTHQEQPGTRPFIGALGGVIDTGETVTGAAARELGEEAGLAAGKYQLLEASQLVSVMDWAVYTLAATDLRQAGQMQLDGGEKIELAEYGFSQFMRVLARDDFRDREISLLFFRAQANGRLDELKEKMHVSH